MAELWSILTNWTPWHTAVAGALGVWWLFEWARIVSDDGAARRAQSLRGDIFQNYRQSLKNGLAAFARWIGDDYEDGPRDFSALSYLASAGWATLYPMLFLAIGWGVLGSSGRFGELELFKDDATQWAKAVTLIGSAMMLLGPSLVLTLFGNLGSSERPDVALAVALVGALAVALAGAVAGFGAVVLAFVIAGTAASRVAGASASRVAGASAGAVVVVYALAGAVASAGPSPDIVAGAFAVAFAVASAVAAAAVYTSGRADAKRRGWAAMVVIAVVLLLLPLLLSAWDQTAWWINLEKLHQTTSGKIGPNEAGSLVLFLVLLPAVNAPLDWVSLGISRFFIRNVATAEGRVWEVFDNRFLGPFAEPFVIAVDLALGLVIAFLVVVATAFFVSLFDTLHAATGGRSFYDVPAYVDAVRANPSDPKYYWIYAMMFWTLVPTLVHSIAFTGGVVMGALKPFGVGNGLAWLMERKSWLARFVAAGLLIAIRVSPVLLLTAAFLVYAPWLLSLFGLTWAGFGNALATSARDAAELAAAIAHLLVGR